MKVRGAAQHVYEKYQQLARDAHTAGDRVLAENYLQHAEHYFRVMRAMQPQRPISEIIGRDQFVSGYDIDFEDESGLGDGGETEASDAGGDGGDGGDRYDSRRDERPREDYRPRDEARYSDSRPRDERSRDDRGQQDRYQGDRGSSDRSHADRPNTDRSNADRPNTERTNAERSQGDRPPQDRSGGDRPSRSNRDERPRYNRDDRPRGEPRAEQAERPAADAMSVIEPQATPLPAPAAAPAAALAPANMLRADDGDVSHAPAFLQVRPAESREEGAAEPRRPRRRRTPATFDAGETPAPATVPTSEEV